MILRAVAALALLLLAACDADLPLPSTPVERDRRPVLAGFTPEAAFGSERIELSGANLGQPGERVTVVFAGGASAGADQTGTGERLVVEVPVDAQSGPLRIVTTFGQAESVEPFDFLGPDELGLNALAGTLDLRLRLNGAFEVGDAGDLAISHRQGGFLLSPDGTTSDFPRVVALRPGGVVAFAPGGAGCAGALFVVADEAGGSRRTACLASASSSLHVLDAAVSADGRWALAVSQGVDAWAFDLDAATLAPRTPTGVSGSLAAGVSFLSGSRFLVAGSRGVHAVDAATGTSVPVFTPPIDDGRITAVRAAGDLFAVAFAAGHVRLFQLGSDDVARPLRTLRLATSVRVTDGSLFLSRDGRFVLVAGVDDHLYLWDLTRASDGPAARFHVDGGWTVTPSRDGTLLRVGALGGFHVIDLGSLREVGFTPVLSELGAIRLNVTPAGLTLVVNRGGARDVAFVNGETYEVTAVPVADDLLSLVPEPGRDVVWALGRDAVWRVTPTGAERWVELPPDPLAAGIQRIDSTGILAVFLQYANGVTAAWIDPSKPAGERYFGEVDVGGTWYDAAYVFGTRLVTVSWSEQSGDADEYAVDVWEAGAVDADHSPELVMDLLGPVMLGHLPLPGELLLYDAVPDGVPITGFRLDPHALTSAPFGPVPHIGLEGTISPSGRLAVWREGSAAGLQSRLVSATLDLQTLERRRVGPTLAIEDGYLPVAVLPRGDAVVLVDRNRDRLALVR